METIKRTVVEIKTTDGKRVDIGTKVYLKACGYVIIGTFDGIAKKGAWKFKGIGKFADVTFNIMPKSIEEMYIAGENMFNIPFYEDDGK